MADNSPLILVVEDDAVLRLVICAALSASRYRVIEAGTGQQALSNVAAQHPGAILLDLGLPDMSGLEVIRQLRNSRCPPIIVFSAGGVQQDKIAALEAGAVDYFAKPFVIGDLLSRLRSILRRSERSEVDSESRFIFGELNVDLLNGRITIGKKEVQLTSLEFRLLTIFVRNAGSLLTYRSLVTELWGSNNAPEDAALRTVVATLRHKLEADPVRPRYLIAETGVGYRFCDE